MDHQCDGNVKVIKERQAHKTSKNDSDIDFMIHKNTLRNQNLNESEVSVKDINIALVIIEVEHIVGFNSGRTLLFVSKDQINPLVEMSTDVITL